MKNFEIDQAVYDKYIDTTVELFMECCSNALSNQIKEELHTDEDQNIDFPKELDERYRALIKKECAKQNRKTSLKMVTKGLKMVAAFAVVLLSMASLLFISVEAIRIPIINYYVAHGDGHWIISGSDNQEQQVSTESIDLQNPLGDILPDEYTLVVVEGNSLERLTAIYEGNSGKRIFFTSISSTSYATVDSEGAQISKKCVINGHDAILIVDGSSVRIIWIDENTNITYSILTDNIDQEYAIKITEKIISQLG